MWQTHQCRGAEGELTGGRALLLCPQAAVLLGAIQTVFLLCQTPRCKLCSGSPTVRPTQHLFLDLPKVSVPPWGWREQSCPLCFAYCLLHAAHSWRSGCNRGWRTAGPRETGQPMPATSRAPGSVTGCGHAASHGTCSGAHLCLLMASGTRWVLPWQLAMAWCVPAGSLAMGFSPGPFHPAWDALSTSPPLPL